MQAKVINFSLFLLFSHLILQLFTLFTNNCLKIGAIHDIILFFFISLRKLLN